MAAECKRCDVRDQSGNRIPVTTEMRRAITDLLRVFQNGRELRECPKKRGCGAVYVLDAPPAKEVEA